MFDLSIVLPTRNRADQLLKALMGIERNTHCSYEVVVVDGASTDSTNDVLMLAGSIMGSRLRTVREGTCVGFAAACNKGIAASRGRHLAILHDDSHPLDSALDRAVRQLDERSDDRAVVALYARPDASMAVAMDRIINGDSFALGHVRGTLIAEYPVAPRRVFESIPLDTQYQTSAAILDWSFAAWDAQLQIIPAIDSVLEQHFEDASSCPIDKAEFDRVVARWNVPAANTKFDAKQHCQLRSRREKSIAA